ncbi:hypothetical protein OYC42_23580 [Escherichia coli]|nr:hypothetical protein [Escherichia coli]
MEDNGVMTVSVIPQYKPLIAEFKDIDKLSSADFEIFVRDLFVASGWTDAETYRGQPLNLVRFKQLPSDVQEQIKNKYQSAFVFLKKLKDAL